MESDTPMTKTSATQLQEFIRDDLDRRNKEERCRPLQDCEPEGGSHACNFAEGDPPTTIRQTKCHGTVDYGRRDSFALDEPRRCPISQVASDHERKSKQGNRSRAENKTEPPVVKSPLDAYKRPPNRPKGYAADRDQHPFGRGQRKERDSE